MSAGGTDLVSALWMAGGIVGALLIIAAILIWFAKRRRSASIALDLVMTLSSWFVLMNLIGLALGLLGTFTNSWILFDSAAIAPFSPSSSSCASGGPGDATSTASPRIDCLNYDHAQVTIGSPTIEMRWTVALIQLLSTVAFLTPFAVVALISFQAIARRPFHTLTTRALYIGAALVAVTGLGADLATSVGQTLVLREVLSPGDVGYPEYFRIESTLWPVGAALLMAALAAIFRHGARLQSEKARLEDETDRLRRDTEGLV
ncbi:hypothetical protein GCM10017576_15690 [Microbacterium barkeri]|uniref:Uncharacterized protein n=1 Tax=Microbacterium barkeri TaxID=33917 RepID=A0A9W6H2R2_9MICO|nr:hypothetical protein GCM10017576_15690 [Microbacterium barkeri]